MASTDRLLGGIVGDMSDPERPASSIDLVSALQAAGVGLGPVTPTRRLTQSPDRVVEFYSSEQGGRLLAVEQYSADDVLHGVMADNGMPVFQQAPAPEGFTFLRVPPGAYSLRSRLQHIRAIPSLYETFFADIVLLQQRQLEAGLGVIARGDVPLLNHFVVVEDDRSLTGLSPYIVPPYGLDAGGTLESFTAGLLDELAGTGMFAENQMERLRTVLQQGVGGYGPVS